MIEGGAVTACCARALVAAEAAARVAAATTIAARARLQPSRTIAHGFGDVGALPSPAPLAPRASTPLA